MKEAVAISIQQPNDIIRARVADYLELIKPRIAILVLFTVAAGFWTAALGFGDCVLLFHVLVGTAILASAANALNQWVERRSDALMRRTENRPLPSGRLFSTEVFALGCVLALTGILYLAIFVQKPLCVFLGALTLFSYVGIYTPLKRITTLNTLVGAVPGALPPLIGWSAVRDDITPLGMVLFLILFLWQVPHFLAIAWIYREDYGRADLKMLPVVDPSGKITGRQMFLYCGCLFLVSMIPIFIGQVGIIYFLLVGLTGLGFQATTLAFVRRPENRTARLVLRASLLYLPLTLISFVFCVVNGL